MGDWHRCGWCGDRVYFLSFEINDRVAEMNIPSYAIGFFIASAVMFLAALGITVRNLYKYNSKQNFRNA